jgi:hypothetical protein
MFETHVHTWREWELECDDEMQVDITSLRNHKPNDKNDKGCCPTRSIYCISQFNYIYSIFFVYYSVWMLFFLTHYKKVMCVLTHQVTIFTYILEMWLLYFFLLGHEHTVYYFTTTSKHRSSKLSTPLVY